MSNVEAWIPLMIAVGFFIFMYAVWQRYTVVMDKLTQQAKTDGD